MQTVACDETLYEYFSKEEEDDCRLRYYPNKPHSNDLIVFHLAATTAKGPYLIDLEIDTSNLGINPLTAVLRFAQHISHPLHIVHDAGFTREDMIPIASDIEVALSCSYNKTCKEWLLELLNRTCLQHSWFAVVGKQGVIWSLIKKGSEAKLLAISGFEAEGELQLMLN